MAQQQQQMVEVPYGYRVAPDAVHLEVDPRENKVLLRAMEWIVQDYGLTEVARRLNEEGFRTRRDTLWGPATVFDLLPRLIESGPRIFTSEEWASRRRQLGKLLAH